jgi:hypothetical protein
MLNTVLPQPFPESVTVVGLKLGVVAVTIEGDVVSLGVMVPLYPFVGTVGQNWT